MQTQEPMLISRSCLDKSIAVISDNLIRSPRNNSGAKSPCLILNQVQKQIAATVSQCSNIKENAKLTDQETGEEKLGAWKTSDTLGQQEQQDQEYIRQKKTSDVDNGELIELLQENRQQTTALMSKRQFKRNKSIDVACLSHDSNSVYKTKGHFLLFYQQNAARDLSAMQ